MRFRAQLQEMASTEILSMIPPYFIEDVKRRDPKPLFKAFIVGQEGEAEGSFLGIGKVVKTWFKDAIGKLSRKIYPGMSIFSGHARDTNEHEGRMQIGQVAGSRTKTVDGKFSAMIAAYIFPEYKTMPFDVASIEADINVDNMSGDVHAVHVDEITGIALGNSKIDKPGFPGATLLGQLQAFATGQSQAIKGGGYMPSIDEIKKFVAEEGISPSEIFGRDALIDDPAVKGYVDEREKIASSGEYAHRKRTDDKFDSEKKKWEEEREQKDEEIKTLKTKEAQRNAKELIEKKVKERKLDDKQKKFIESKQNDFLPEDLDAVEKEVDKFLDARVEEFNMTAKIFGHKISETRSSEEESKPGGEPGSGSNEEENDLIPD